jgi:hypothetical protein
MKRVIGVALALPLLFAFLTAPANAMDLDPYTDTNPATTGCAADAITIASRSIASPQAVHGTMEVRYSPSCGTNWVRANMLVPSPGHTVTKGILRFSSQPDGHGGWLSFYQNYERDPAVGSSFGMQVYAPGSTCIQAMSSVRDGSGQLVASTGTASPYDPWVTFC